MEEAASAAAAAAVPPAGSAPPPPITPPPPPPPVQPTPATQASSCSSPAKEPREEAPQPPPPPLPQAATESQRLRFSVELKPGETTIVSWKRLLKEAGKAGGSPCFPTGADAVVSMQVGPSGAPAEKVPKEEVPPPSRFSAVIEKIERLYMGKQSSDEEADDIPDEDQYDTEDSFIDDTELDEYFQVDKLTTKHDGYFVNKGKLEHFEPSLSPKEAPKKRRRKDRDLVSDEPANAANMRIKDAARSAPLVGRNLLSSAKVLTPYGKHCIEEGRVLKHKSSGSSGIHKKRSADFTIKSELLPASRARNKDVSSLPLEPKDFDKHKAGFLSSEISKKSRAATEAFDPAYQALRCKGQVEFQSKKVQNGENEEVSNKVRNKERYAVGDFSGTSPSVNVCFMQAVQASRKVKEGSSVRPKGTTLERAIRDLERIVAECRPPSLDIQDVDPAFQGVKRRLPQEVKQKLAKVARLSAGQGKIPKNQLIDRLMGILGHLVQRRTLKENMKKMVELGLSAKQQKADRFQLIKKEINEMIGARVSQPKSKVAEQKDGSTDDFQDDTSNGERRALKSKFAMDAALEDKICELYDLYVEGMDEDKGPRSRKLYVELAELWPSGYMDNIGIKDAIYRSKERKRAVIKRHKVRDEERIKRRKLAALRAGEINLSDQVRAGRERSLTDNAGQTISSSDKPVSSQLAASASRLLDLTPPSNSDFYGSRIPEKVRGGSMSTSSEEASKSLVDLKRKMKRKPESDLAEIHGHLPKISSQHVEKQRFQKNADDVNMNHQPKSNAELPAVSGSNQPS